MDKPLFQRRKLLGYFGLGLLGAGAATTALRRSSGLKLASPLAAGAGDQRPEVAIAPNGTASTDRSAALPMQMQLPDFQGIHQWLNSDPLTVAELKGSVVLIQFWTFACMVWGPACPCCWLPMADAI